ncbi:MAG: hypothetical protein ACR2HJ_06080 [Fimbriimonadales bacterium]
MSRLESYGQDPSSERGLFVLELARGRACKAGLAIAIGEPSWATTIEGVFKNPRAFSEAWLDKNGGQ